MCAKRKGSDKTGSGKKAIGLVADTGLYVYIGAEKQSKENCAPWENFIGATFLKEHNAEFTLSRENSGAKRYFIR